MITVDERRQWVFPAARTYADPVCHEVPRRHLHATVVQRAICGAVMAAQITNPPEAGYDIRTIQELRGCKDVT